VLIVIVCKAILAAREDGKAPAETSKRRPSQAGEPMAAPRGAHLGSRA
jgi:hypothetical protein